MAAVPGAAVARVVAGGASKAVKGASKAGNAAVAAGGAVAGSAPVVALDKAASKAARTPRAIVRGRTRSVGQLFWSVVVTLLALSLLALVLQAASSKPGQLNAALQWLPGRIRQFVNPWQDPATGRPLLDGKPLQGPPAPASLAPQGATFAEPAAPAPQTAQIVRPLPDQSVRVTTENNVTTIHV